MNALAVIRALWLLWGGYWLAAAFRRKPLRRRESRVQRFGHVGLLGLAILLIYSSGPRPSWLIARFVPASPAVAVASVALVLAGLAFAIWARVHLGRNWSAEVTIREGHELIRSGPYAWIRHPIYSGILLALVGTAIAIGDYRALLGFAIVTLGLFFKARREERFLAQEFGAAFEEHKRHTGLFLPNLGARDRG